MNWADENLPSYTEAIITVCERVELNTLAQEQEEAYDWLYPKCDIFGASFKLSLTMAYSAST